jgi:tetratricopeptide (TPR) repeat protein
MTNLWARLRLLAARYLPDRTSQIALGVGAGNVIIQVTGDGNQVVAGYPYVKLTRYLNRRTTGAAQLAENQASVLSPYSFAIPLIGRQRQLEDLWTWMRSPKWISVRVLTAPTGAGKTRLGLELCEQAVAEGWAAGFLTRLELKRAQEQQNLSAWRWNRPTLIVVDYAAAIAHRLRGWLIELADNSLQPAPPLRLLLLERHADPSSGWWREAFGVGGGDAEAVKDLLDPPMESYALPRITDSDDRRRILSVAIERIGSPTPSQEVGGYPTLNRRLNDLSWGAEPLFLLMAALEATHTPFGEIFGLSAVDLAFRLADHEVNRIRDIADGREVPAALLAHLAAYATLCHGLPLSEMRAVIDEERRPLRYEPGVASALIDEAIAAVLPHEGEILAAIEPGILAGAFLLRALGGGVADQAGEAVARAAAHATEEVAATVIQVLQDYGSARPEPVHWFKILADERRGDLESLESLLELLPDSTLVLREEAVSLTEQAALLARQQGRPDHLAWHLHNLSIRLANLGKIEEALAASREAVELFRGLAGSQPEIFRPLLPMALGNHSIRLGALGRWEEALAPVQESVDLLRQLPMLRPEKELRSRLENLAAALNTLSSHLHRLGRVNEALAAIENAVGMKRTLVATWPEDTRLASLAGSINNLSNRQGDVGQLEKALASSQEAVVICRDLAASRPDSFLENLADALGTLSIRLAALNRWDDAARACQEAVKILRRLTTAFPSAFKKDLAIKLSNLSGYQANLGRKRDALASSEEASTILRDLALLSPRAVLPEFSNSLHNLALSLAALGRKEEAARAMQDLVVAWRTGEAVPLNARNWHSLGYGVFLQSKEATDPSEQLELLEESAAAYRNTISLDPEDSRARTCLGMLLDRASRCVVDAPRAHELLDEAVAVLRPATSAVGATAGMAREMLVRALCRRAEVEGDPDRRRDFVEEAVSIARDEVRVNPESSAAWFLRGLSLGLVAGLDGDDGFSTANGQESVLAYRKAVALDQGNTRAWFDLGARIHCEASSQSHPGRRALLEEAIDIYRKVIDKDQRYFEAWSNLGVALRALALCSDPLTVGELVDQALEATKRALALAPNDRTARFNLAVAIEAQASRATSRERLEELLKASSLAYHGALERDPSYLEALEGLCRLCEQAFCRELAEGSELCANALMTFETSLTVQPSNPSWYGPAIAMSRLASKQGSGPTLERMRELEISAYRAFLQARPDGSMAWVNLGISLWEKADRQAEPTEKSMMQDEALDAFRQAIAVNTRETKGLLLLGRALAERADKTEDSTEACTLREEALSTLKKVMVTEPLSGDVLFDAATVVNLLAAQERDPERRNRLAAETVVAYRRAVAAAPDHVQAQYQLGIHLAYAAKAGRSPETEASAILEEAIGVLRTAATLDKVGIGASYTLGTVLLGRFLLQKEPRLVHWLDEAIVAFEQAVREQPMSVPAWGQLGLAKAQRAERDETLGGRTRRRNEALDFLRRAVEADRSSGLAWRNLASTLRAAALETTDPQRRAAAWDETFAALREAETAGDAGDDLRERFFETLQMRAAEVGDAAAERRLHLEAIAVLERAMITKPWDAPLCNNLGTCLHRLYLIEPNEERRAEVLSEAIRMFETAAASAGVNGFFWINLAVVLIETVDSMESPSREQRAIEAMAALKRARELLPSTKVAEMSSLMSRLFRAGVRIIGDRDAAVEALALARQAFDYNHSGRVAIATALALVGQVDEAVTELQAALDSGETTTAAVIGDPDWDFIRGDPRVTRLLTRNAPIS